MKRRNNIFLSTVVVALGLVSCSDTDIIPNVTSATCAAKIEMQIPAEYAQYLYTDNTGTQVLPLVKGQSVQLGYTLEPQDITFDNVKWSATEASVASVDAGKVEALSGSGLGYSIITVSPVGMFPGSGVTSTLKVKVSDQLVSASSVTLTPSVREVYEGETLTMAYDIAPETATYRTLKWTSSNPAVASVDNNGQVTGGTVPSGTRATVTITATALDGSGTSASEEITVLRMVQPQDITISQQYSADNGYCCALNEHSLTLNFTTVPAESTFSLIEWTSSDESAAKVENGIVTFTGFGSATITARCPETGKTSEIKLSVPAGLVRETYHNPDWYSFYNAAQTGNGTASSHEWHDGYITVTTYMQNATTARGDLKWWRTPVTLHAGNYPILAVKLDDVKDLYKAEGVTARNLNFDCVGKSESGKDFKALGGGNNKYTGDIKCSDGSHVFIYDLSTLAFGTGGLAPTNESISFSVFQIKYADIKTIDHQITYNVYWLQTFKSIDEVKKHLSDVDHVTLDVIK